MFNLKNTGGTITMSKEVSNNFNQEDFDSLLKEMRFEITDMICKSGSGHLGGALSLVEIIITLYKRIMKTDAKNPRWEDRDRLVLSKGHAGPVLYSMLANEGFFPKEWLYTLNQNGTKLPSHVDQIQTPGIDMTAGSLGQGLSCASGIALAGKMNKKDYNVFCIIGDGESNEGQVWEAGLFAAHQKLGNLIAITDYNKMQIDGTTDEILSLEPLAEKWKQFGWEVFEMNGHDWDEIYTTIQKAINVKDKPSMIIAHTIKAKGHCIFENKVGSHNIKIPDQKTYDEYIQGLEYDYEK